MYLEFLKNIKFMVEKERPLGIAHCFCLHFIVRFCSLANSGQLSHVGLHLVSLHLVGSSLTTHLAYLTLKTIILDHG